MVTRMPQEVQGAICPNCGSETIWPMALGRAQCRNCLFFIPDIEVVMKSSR